jgi:basic amino acid/polyamine antiporter, APA family
MRDGDGSHLLRVLGVAFGVAVVVGGTIGQGILRSPGLVAQGVSSPALIIGLWVFGGLVSFIDAMSTIELASSIRETGGPYTFARRAFGPFAGLAVGITDWLGNMAAIAYVTVVLGEYLHRLGIATAVPVGMLAIATIAIMGAINWLGTRISGRSQEIGSAVKALLFLTLTLVLLFAPRGEPVASIPAAGMAVGLTLTGMAVALRSIFSTYTGWNEAAYFCEEVTDPRKQIARATFTGLAVIMAIYVMVNVALLRVLTPTEMAGSTLVAADAAARIFGKLADPIVTGISLISLITITNVNIMTFPRVLFAMAREFGVPGLSHVAKNGTPKVALLVTLVISGLLASIGVYDLLLSFSASLLTAMALSVNVAALVMRWREPKLERPYSMPLFPLPAVIAMLINATLLAVFILEDMKTAAEAFGALVVLTAVAWLAIRRGPAKA